MSSAGAARPAAPVTAMSARSRASRINGAKSRGPKSPEGKARSAQNAVKHGLRAQRFVVLPDEDAAEYEAHEEALVVELAPEGALQTLLARRVAAAAWRLLRADRIEAELFEHQCYAEGNLGLALVRDGYGARTFQTLLRYRGAAQAELWRSLRTLKALQAEAAATPVSEAGPVLAVEAKQHRASEPAPDRRAGEAAMAAIPIEPESRGDSRESQPGHRVHEPGAEHDHGEAEARPVPGEPQPRRQRSRSASGSPQSALARASSSRVAAP